MKFRTEYIPLRSDGILSPERPVALIGSCFSNNIASRMRYSLWKAVNPFGSLYNPISINNALRLALSNSIDDRNYQIFDSCNIFHSRLFDSSFSGRSKEFVATNIDSAIKNFTSTLKEGRTLIVTFGSSIVYELISDSGLGKISEHKSNCFKHSESDRNSLIVGNCHKQSSHLFSKRRLSIDEIADCWISLVDDLRKRYEDISIIFTVSPIRHLSDGMAENNRSKSTLILSIEKICQYHENFCIYFPSFEIMMDDLRDYRFYDSDLVHPNSQAIEYIWDKFKKSYLTEGNISLLKEGEKFMKSISHRSILETSEERLRRLSKIREDLNNFISIHPYMINPLKLDLL